MITSSSREFFRLFYLLVKGMEVSTEVVPPAPVNWSRKTEPTGHRMLMGGWQLPSRSMHCAAPADACCADVKPTFLQRAALMGSGGGAVIMFIDGKCAWPAPPVQARVAEMRLQRTEIFGRPLPPPSPAMRATPRSPARTATMSQPH